MKKISGRVQLLWVLSANYIPMSNVGHAGISAKVHDPHEPHICLNLILTKVMGFWRRIGAFLMSLYLIELYTI